jgi:4-amino-4-deoxy-L-arabinose transferase-like glycosyltransferase
LGKFITADEHYWVYERIPQYWNAIAEGKWKKTFINDKPGVSVALVSGIGYFFYPNASEHCIEQNDKIIDCQEKITESLYKTFRLPILLINGLLMIFLFFLIKKISDQWVALWTIILTSLSPILLGISQIINPDSLIWSFGSVGIFSFFIFLQEKKFHHLIITAVFTGLAILSKYSALILFPFYVILAVLFLCIIKNDSQFLSPRKILPFFFSAFTAIIFGSFILISFFLPALILNYKYLNLFLSTIPHKGMFFTLGAIFFLIFIIDMVFLKSSLFLIVRKHCQRYLSSLKSIPLFLALLLLIIIVLRVAMSEWDIFTRIPFDIKNFENARYYGVSVNVFRRLGISYRIAQRKKLLAYFFLLGNSYSCNFLLIDISSCRCIGYAALQHTSLSAFCFSLRSRIFKTCQFF